MQEENHDRMIPKRNCEGFWMHFFVFLQTFCVLFFLIYSWKNAWEYWFVGQRRPDDARTHAQQKQHARFECIDTCSRWAPLHPVTWCLWFVPRLGRLSLGASLVLALQPCRSQHRQWPAAWVGGRAAWVGGRAAWVGGHAKAGLPRAVGWDGWPQSWNATALVWLFYVGG